MGGIRQPVGGSGRARPAVYLRGRGERRHHREETHDIMITREGRRGCGGAGEDPGAITGCIPWFFCHN